MKRANATRSRTRFPFRRERLPHPSDYYAAEGLTMKGGGEWKSAIPGKARTTIWRWIKAGLFPAAVTIGPNSIAWRRSDFESWASDPAEWAAQNGADGPGGRP